MSIEVIFYDKKKDVHVDMLNPKNGFSSLQVMGYIEEEIKSQKIDQTSLSLITIIMACDICGIGPNIFEKFPINSLADAQNVREEIAEEMRMEKKVARGKRYGEELPPEPGCKNCLQQSKANQN